jgi:hypothetical protein
MIEYAMGNWRERVEQMIYFYCYYFLINRLNIKNVKSSIYIFFGEYFI